MLHLHAGELKTLSSTGGRNCAFFQSDSIQFTRGIVLWTLDIRLYYRNVDRRENYGKLVSNSRGRSYGNKVLPCLYAANE